MATQSTTYNTDGTTRTFPSTKPIPTISHVGVYLKRVIDNVWVQVNVGDYTLVQNSVIMDNAPDTLIYSQLEVRVADDPAEITTSPSNVAIVAGDTTAINTVATNINAVTTVSTNMGAVTNTSANIAMVSTVSAAIANVNAAGSNITNINTVAGISGNVTAVAGNATNINSVATNIVPNLAEILLADNNATIATTKAAEATASATSARASELAATAIVTAPLIGAIGNINSPLLDMPLKNSLAMKAGVGSATFTRASTATYIDRYGVLRTAAIDEARFEKEGYLNEGGSTNLLTYSEQFDNAVWAKSNATVTANTTATLDPYGTNLADKFIESATTSTHTIQTSCNWVAGTTYTRSLFVKAGERTQIDLAFLSAAFTVNQSVLFDLINKTGTVGTGTPTYTIDEIGNSWFRISITATATTTTTANDNFQLANGGAISYLGDGTSGLYIFGAQLEALPFATSYIPTVASTVTRSAGVLKVTYLNNFASYLKPYTMIADLNLLGLTYTSNRSIFGTESSLHGWVVISTTGAISHSSAGTANVSTNTNALLQFRVAVSSDGTILKTYKDGIKQADEGTVGTNVQNITSLYIGSTNGTTNVMYGHIANVRIWDKALTAQEAALA